MQIKKMWTVPTLILIYLVSTYILYIIGPYDWPNKNFPILTIYLILVFILIVLAFYLSLNKKSTIKNNNNKFTLLKFCILLNLFYQIWGIVSYTNIDNVSFTAIADNLLNSIVAPGESYYDKFGNVPIAFGITATPWVVLSPLTYSAAPLLLYNFKKLGMAYRILGILGIIIELIRWLSIGTNQGLISIAFIFISVYIIKRLRYSIQNSSNEFFKINFKKLITRGLMIFFIILGILYFIISVGDRLSSVQSFQTGGIYPNLDNWLIKYPPEFISAGIILITNYLTQGYYALSLLLPLSNESMFGIGHSNFLISNFSEVFEKNLFLNTYQMKIANQGWHPTQYYHTFFTWVANDIGFSGALIVIFFLTYYLGFLLRKAVYEESQLAIVLISLVLSIFFYLPSNNVVLSTPNTFMAFWLLTFSLIYSEYFPRLTLLPRKRY